MESKYVWRQNSLAKNIDPDKAVKELEKIEKDYGSLTPENVLEACKNESSLLHNLFNWDDKSAANQYRLQQARTLINNVEVRIITDGETRQVPVYENIISNNERVYKSIETFTANDVEQVRAQAVREINAWKNKLSFFSQFSKVTKKLNQAVELLN